MKKVGIRMIAFIMTTLITMSILSVSAFAASDLPDCNADKVADVRDLVHLKKALAASSSATEFDLNRDTKVDSLDCVAMRQYLLGIAEIHMNEDVAADIF